MIAKNLGSGKAIYDALIPIAEERLEERAQKKLGHVVPEHVCTYLLNADLIMFHADRYDSMTAYNGSWNVRRDQSHGLRRG